MLNMNRTKKHIEALNADDDATRWEAVRTLKTIDAEYWDGASDDEMHALVEMLCQQLPRRSEASGARLPTHLRRDVAFILGKIGDRAADAVPSMVELLKEDEPEGIREAAATALGDLRDVGRPAIPALLAVLTPNCRVPLAVRVACALGEIGGADARVRAALTDLWRSTVARPITQIQIALALCKLEVDRPGLITNLAARAVARPNASHPIPTFPGP